MRIHVKTIWQVLKTAASDWREDKAPMLGAALAYYTLFSLAPLLVLITAMAGVVFGREAVHGELVGQLSGLLGQDGGRAVETMIANAGRPKESILATVIGIVMLLVGASGVFGQLQEALNIIWEVKPKKGGGFKGILRHRFLSFAMILVIGFLLLVSLVVSTAVAALGAWIARLQPELATMWHLVNTVASLAVITVLFALIFKVLPDAKIQWRDVWVGAAITSLMFVIGKFGISFYLARSTVTSVYGAAGSLVVILIWAYYSAQILLFGAEVSQAYGCVLRGCRAEPKEFAQPITQDERKAQGMEPKQPARRPVWTPT